MPTSSRRSGCRASGKATRRWMAHRQHERGRCHVSHCPAHWSGQVQHRENDVAASLAMGSNNVTPHYRHGGGQPVRAHTLVLQAAAPAHQALHRRARPSATSIRSWTRSPLRKSRRRSRARSGSSSRRWKCSGMRMSRREMQQRPEPDEPGSPWTKIGHSRQPQRKDDPTRVPRDQ